MKRLACFVTMIALVLTSVAAYATTAFDISVFENNENYVVNYDDMNDTGTITIAGEGSYFTGETDKFGDSVTGVIAIVLTDSLPPTICIYIQYNGDDIISSEKVILKTDTTRYTFTVQSKSDYESGKFTDVSCIAISDQTIEFFSDVATNNTSKVKFRIDGTTDVDGYLYFDPAMLGMMYDDYIKAGALSEDLAIYNILYPCEIKQVTD